MSNVHKKYMTFHEMNNDQQNRKWTYMTWAMFTKQDELTWTDQCSQKTHELTLNEQCSQKNMFYFSKKSNVHQTKHMNLQQMSKQCSATKCLNFPEMSNVHQNKTWTYMTWPMFTKQTSVYIKWASSPT
jgi:hypothetical protein